MGELVRLPPRQPPPPVRPSPGSLADKIQWLVLNHPTAAEEVEKMLDRLRVRLEHVK